MDISTEKTDPRLFSRALDAYRRFATITSRVCLSKYFMLGVFVVAVAIAALTPVSLNYEQLAESEKISWVTGGMVLVVIICLQLVLCSDAMATTLPFLLLCVFLTRCYDTADLFVKYVWVAIPVVFSLVFHFVVFHKKFSLGKSFWGIVAISVPLLLGGLGTISPAEYFAPVTLFYTLMLGVGMVGAYMLLRSEFSGKRDYDPAEKFAAIMYAMGIYACAVVLLIYSTANFNQIIVNRELPYFQCSNNLATFLMFALPFPFYFSLKRNSHVWVAVLIYLCIILCNSRGGLIFGTVEFMLLLAATAAVNKKYRFQYVCVLVGFLGIAAAAASVVLDFYVGVGIKHEIVNPEEGRMRFLIYSFKAFRSNPIFGRGLGDAGMAELDVRAKGALEWYHMIIPQVYGSMGVVGILGYGYQLINRIMLTVRHYSSQCLYLALSYGGLLLMSQVNPGEFCPIPYGLMAVMIFIFIENTAVTHPAKRRTKKPMASQADE